MLRMAAMHTRALVHRSALMKRVYDLHTAEPAKAGLVAGQILDNALISAGLLEDATPMVQRLYKLLETV